MAADGEDHESRIRKMEQAVTELKARLSPIEKIVFGAVGLALLSLGGALLATVIVR